MQEAWCNGRLSSRKTFEAVGARLLAECQALLSLFPLVGRALLTFLSTLNKEISDWRRVRYFGLLRVRNGWCLKPIWAMHCMDRILVRDLRELVLETQPAASALANTNWQRKQTLKKRQSHLKQWTFTSSLIFETPFPEKSLFLLFVSIITGMKSIWWYRIAREFIDGYFCQ